MSTLQNYLSEEYAESDLQHVELPIRVFEDAVDAVGDVEAVTPVMVGHLPVVLLHSDEESDLK